MKKTIYYLLLVLYSVNVLGQAGNTTSQRWSEEKANAWYKTINWGGGFNYVPSTAANTTEFWQKESFDPVTIDRELGWAKDLGYTSTRVFLQYIVWKDDPAGMRARFETFLQIADKHKISVVPVLYDDCSFGLPKQLDPYLGKQRDPIPGMILPSWTPSPGVKIGLDPAQRPELKKYTVDIVSAHKNDRRIIFWDLFNEPMNNARTGTPEFLADIFAWARDAGAQQPLTMSPWSGNAATNEVMLSQSDIISYHRYSNYTGMKAAIANYKKYNRPVVCTEWMARASASNFATDLPLFKEENVIPYQWGLVNGRTQCQFSWANQPGGVVNEGYGWFHDILYPDGKPYRQDEIDAIKTVLKGKK